MVHKYFKFDNSSLAGYRMDILYPYGWCMEQE